MKIHIRTYGPEAPDRHFGTAELSLELHPNGAVSSIHHGVYGSGWDGEDRLEVSRNLGDLVRAMNNLGLVFEIEEDADEKDDETCNCLGCKETRRMELAKQLLDLDLEIEEERKRLLG